jgi:transcriptional regulator with XRE-family HTH domain
MLGVVKTRALDDSRNEAVRATVRALMRDRYEGNLSRTARAIGVSPSLLSELLAGSRGAGMRFVQKLSAITGQPLDVLIGASSAGDDSTPEYRNAPGWKDAASALLSRGYAPYVVERAGKVRKLTSQPVTLEGAIAAAQLVMAEIPLDEDIRLASEAIEKQYKGAETRAAKRLEKGKGK